MTREEFTARIDALNKGKRPEFQAAFKGILEALQEGKNDETHPL